MVIKAGILFLTLLVGSLALPLNEEQDMSYFFDYPASTPRIIGGTLAGTVPHMVALSTGVHTRTFTCGGSLITNRHVLTAAHCIRFVQSNGVLVNSLRGTVGTNRWNRGGTQYQFSGYVIHPKYDHLYIKNDIGILMTVNSVVQNNNIRTVPISYDFIESGVETVVNGWGRTRMGGSMSSTLRELRPIVVDGDRCVVDVAKRALEVSVSAPPVLPDINICTFLSVNRGTCHGDSGSALLRQSDGWQIGIVSWGLPCARNAPDIFVRLSVYRSWILESTKPESVLKLC